MNQVLSVLENRKPETLNPPPIRGRCQPTGRRFESCLPTQMFSTSRLRFAIPVNNAAVFIAKNGQYWLKAAAFRRSNLARSLALD